MKFVWPLAWLGMISYFNFQAFTDSPDIRWGAGVDPGWGKPLLLGFLVLGLLVTYLMCARLKKVWLTPDGIRVSNYFREAAIPWPHVRRVVVRGTFGHRSSPLVELELREKHPFAGRISLLPASEHCLAELTERAAAFDVQCAHR